MSEVGFQQVGCRIFKVGCRVLTSRMSDFLSRMSDFNKTNVGCRIFKVGCRMAPISFRKQLGNNATSVDDPLMNIQKL